MLNQLPKVAAVIAQQSRVDACDITLDGKRIAIGSKDGNAVVYSVDSQRELAELKHETSVNQLDFFPMPGLLLTTCDQTVRMWNYHEDRVVRQFDHPDRLRNTQVSVDGTRLFTVTRSGSLFAWDVQTGEMVWKRVYDTQQGVGAIHKNGRFAVCVGDSEGSLECVDMRTDRPVGSLIEASESVESIAVATEKPIAATIDAAGLIRTWNLSGGEILKRYQSQPDSKVFISPEGNLVAVVEGNVWFSPSDVRIWGSSAPGASDHVKLPHPAYVTSVNFETEQNRIITTATDQAVRIWDRKTGRLLQKLFHGGYAMRTATDSSGRYLLVSGGVGESGHAVLWDRNNPASLRFDHSNTVVDAVYSSDAKFIASADVDGRVKIWNSTDASVLHEIDHPSAIQKVEFSNQDQSLLVATKAGRLVRWDWRSRQRKQTIRLTGKDLAWSNADTNGNRLAIAVDANATSIHFAIASQGEIQPGQTLDAGDQLYRAVPSPSGDFIATVGRSSTCRIWKKTI